MEGNITDPLDQTLGIADRPIGEADPHLAGGDLAGKIVRFQFGRTGDFATAGGQIWQPSIAIEMVFTAGDDDYAA